MTHPSADARERRRGLHPAWLQRSMMCRPLGLGSDASCVRSESSRCCFPLSLADELLTSEKIPPSQKLQLLLRHKALKASASHTPGTPSPALSEGVRLVLLHLASTEPFRSTFPLAFPSEQ